MTSSSTWPCLAVTLCRQPVPIKTTSWSEQRNILAAKDQFTLSTQTVCTSWSANAGRIKNGSEIIRSHHRAGNWFLFIRTALTIWVWTAIGSNSTTKKKKLSTAKNFWTKISLVVVTLPKFPAKEIQSWQSGMENLVLQVK